MYDGARSAEERGATSYEERPIEKEAQTDKFNGGGARAYRPI